MPMMPANGIELCYETFGHAADPALLLIMGFGMQMIGWEDGFCRLLADRGFHVIRFDNRDCGLSTKTAGPPPPLVPTEPGAPGYPFKLVGDASYPLSAMAGDAAGLLDGLGIRRAHVVGASLGGMIAQRMAIDFPDRVLTLTSIMSSTGAVDVGQAQAEANAALFSPIPDDREGAIERAVAVDRAIGGPLFDHAKAHRAAEAAFDRSHYPLGTLFQFSAFLADGDRTPALRTLQVPTVVIHGRCDPLVTLSGGEATAAAIPDARLVILETMGHDLPEPLWPQIAGAITATAARAAGAMRG